MQCEHKTPIHFADNGSTSAGVIYWCPDCGAISISSFRDEYEWVAPGPEAKVRYG